MLGEQDIIRLLRELMPQFSSDDAISQWLQKERISEEAWEKIAADIFHTACMDALEKWDEPNAAIAALTAGIQLSFFIGWECGKQYSPKRDMSQT